MLNDDPTNAELMRAIHSVDILVNRKMDDMERNIDRKFGEVQNCLWGANRDNGLVMATSQNTQDICFLKKVVFGVLGALSTLIVGVGTALIMGVI